MRGSRCRSSFFVALSIIAISAISIAAQGDPATAVMLFNGRDGTGLNQPIPVGVYQVNGKQLGSGEASVKVSKGYVVKFCAAKDGTGKCEEFGEGTHNLSSLDFNFIRVAKAGVAAASAPAAAAGPPPLIVYEMAHWSGRSQAYGPGMYRAIKGEFGNILNDHAMSIVVAKGYRARFCAEEGFMLRGSGDCEVHEAGRHDLRFATSISFIQVFDLSDTSPEDDKLPVTLYEEPGQVGKLQGFDVGTFFAARGEFKKLHDDQASSITVKDGYRATVCKDEPSASGSPTDCEEFGPGKKNLKMKRAASYLKVSKASE